MITAVICAAGSGTRTGFAENKIFRELNGLPVLTCTLSAFAPYADEILVACRKTDEARVAALLAPFPAAKCVCGGATRAESVYAALREARGDVVLVHDAARPFVTGKVIEACIASVKRFGAGVAAVPVTDTVAHIREGRICDMPPRDALYALQTPQGFLTEKLLFAYERAFADRREKEFTDDSGVYAAYLAPPPIVPGDAANRKLTFREDFLPAERVGFGTDTHAFAHQDEIDRGIARLNLNYIRLCGVTIPSDRAVEAHSDGDVAIHALMDALLSAIGARDIGFHFPDTDPAYRNADSMKLLDRVMKMVHGGGFFVKNASISILAERPKLSPYIEAMRENLRAAIACETVAIAAGTNEKLGYIGEGRGITAYAAVLLGKKGDPDPAISPLKDGNA